MINNAVKHSPRASEHKHRDQKAEKHDHDPDAAECEHTLFILRHIVMALVGAFDADGSLRRDAVAVVASLVGVAMDLDHSFMGKADALAATAFFL